MQSYPAGVGGRAIRLEKMVPEEVQANEQFEYRIKVANLTDRELTNVVVTDRIHEHMKIKSSSPKAASMEAGEVHWMLGTLGPSATEVITVSAVGAGKGFIASCADVSYDSLICAKIKVVEPKLQLVKTVPSESLLCDRIPVKYVVTNTGTGYACDITIRDKFQRGLMAAEGRSELMFEFESLGPGESKEFTAMLDASKSGRYASKAVAVSRTAGTAESDMPETAVLEPVLAVNETCPASQYIGQPMTFEITVTNKGNAAAKDTVITAMVPENASFDRATKGGVFSHASPGKVVWNLGTLAPNSSSQVSMMLTSNEPGALVTKAMAQAYCAKAASDSCTTSLSGIPAILLEVIDVSDPIEVGKSEIYVITVTNQGSAAGTNIRVRCMLEDSMQYVSSTGATRGSLVGNEVNFAPLASLAPKAQAQWRINVKAVDVGDVRFQVMIRTDQLTRAVEETEATRFYKSRQ
jgi:uncharacterized repeat protein (TIGR01451 family)